MTNRRWYVLRHAPGLLKRAERSLREQEVEAYMPRRLKWRRTQKTKRKVELPLFPGYLFVFCAPADFGHVLRIQEVSGFLGAIGPEGGVIPMPVPTEAVEGLRADEAAGKFDATKRRRAAVNPGDRVRVNGGMWIGYFAKIIATTPDERRAQILVDGKFGGKVTLDVAHLEAAA